MDEAMVVDVVHSELGECWLMAEVMVVVVVHFEWVGLLVDG
jgi:hypothetical protein